MGLFDEAATGANQILNAPNLPQMSQQFADNQVQNQNLMNQGAAYGQNALNVQQELAEKKQQQAFSLLGSIAQQPSEQRDSLYQNMKGILPQISPNMKYPDTWDDSLGRLAYTQQVPPQTQAELQNRLQSAQLMGGIKAWEVTKDPVSGQLVRVNKFTGQQAFLNPQEQIAYQTTGMLPDQNNPSGAYPPQMNVPQPGQQPPAQLRGQPSFGSQPFQAPPQNLQNTSAFPPSSYVTDVPSLNLARKNAAKFDEARGQRDILANQAETKLQELEPDISAVKGGPDLWTQAGFMGAHLVPGGTQNLNKATEADAETKDLALTLSQMQQQPGSRAMKSALQTLLASKPDPMNQTPEANQKLLTNIKSAVAQYKLETEFLDSYKDAHPQHIIDNNAYNLFDSLSKQFPLTTVGQDGKSAFNQQNIEAFHDAIPDALQNQGKYLNARTKAEGQVQTPQGQVPQNQPSQSNAPQQGTVSKGYVFKGGDPSDKNNWMPIQQNNPTQNWLNRAQQ